MHPFDRWTQDTLFPFAQALLPEGTSLTMGWYAPVPGQPSNYAPTWNVVREGTVIAKGGFSAPDTSALARPRHAMLVAHRLAPAVWEGFDAQMQAFDADLEHTGIYHTLTASPTPHGMHASLRCVPLPGGNSIVVGFSTHAQWAQARAFLATHLEEHHALHRS